ncbi:threonine--tRNA ligase [Patescibacteria group bacterium]|nr:threonine--tRNA ligase [Patescibacteria group bacterium]
MAKTKASSNTPDKLETIRHSLSHVLAMAVLDMFPEAKLGVGPAIENGFYYDFELPRTLIPEDLPILEKKMKHIVKQNLSFEGEEVPPKEAIDRLKKAKQPYKVELAEEFAQEKQPITFFTSGSFTDLCRGGHVKSTKDIGSFKLTRIAGAYWKGDEKNKQLQRIYGVAFEDQKELDAYLKQQEEAKKRDHRKLGKELDLFTFSDLVGSGLPMFTPRGTTLRTQLQNSLLEISQKYDMQPVTIPHIAKRELYEKSGHADKFGEELLKVESKYGEFVMKPVNCPHHTQIYASRPRSYRDLPLRYMESTMMYRDEKPGEIGGLTRVRAITCDDGHVFCRVDQIKEESKRIAKTIEEFYTNLGMFGDHWVSLSVRDPKTPDAYIGDEKGWKQAEQMLKEVSDDLKLDAKRMEGEAALYGPKLDYMFRDALGNERQLATIQIDFAMPPRFGLTYAGKGGEEETPVIIHRAILGSYERFLAILIEHFAGAFPLWLAPEQVRVLPITDRNNKYAESIKKELTEAGLRVTVDDRSESIGKKIREAEMQKAPYMLVVGDKEEKSKSVALRSYHQGDLGSKKIAAVAKDLVKESADRVLPQSK